MKLERTPHFDLSLASHKCLAQFFFKLISPVSRLRLQTIVKFSLILEHLSSGTRLHSDHRPTNTSVSVHLQWRDVTAFVPKTSAAHAHIFTSKNKTTERVLAPMVVIAQTSPKQQLQQGTKLDLSWTNIFRVTTLSTICEWFYWSKIRQRKIYATYYSSLL